MIRCKWCNLNNPKYIEYHDNEWCNPNFNDKYLFEMLILESFQAGLSWECILNKREYFREAFDNFDVNKICNYNDEKLRRKKFYLKNGFYETNKFILDNKVEYEILCTNRDYEITEENLKQRYTKMGNNKFINYVISKIINTYNIKFIK